MPNKNNKGQKNGLTVYITQELIPELQRKGERYPKGIRDLVPIALPLYQNLSREEKAKYENMAKMEKAKERESVRPDLRDNLGNLLTDRVDLKEQMKLKRQHDRSLLQTAVKTMTDSDMCNRDAPCDHVDLLEEKFYFVGFQYMICTEDKVYYPIEYGAVEWSMAKGITNAIHGFINPGAIPLGYRYSAQFHSDSSHKIPLDEFQNGESDYRKICIDLERFLKLDKYSNPTVYCMEADYNVVTGCLSALHHRGGMANLFRVNILEELTRALFTHRDFNISDTSMFDMLTTTAYDYEMNTKCAKHSDVTAQHCAIGLPKKYTYALSDALCELYGFSLTPNHLPTASPDYNSHALIEGGCQMIRENCAGVGRGKKLVEPLGFSSRDSSHFPSQNGSKISKTQRLRNKERFDCRGGNDDDDDDDDDDEFRYMDEYPAARDRNFSDGRPTTQSNIPSLFANTAFKAPPTTESNLPSLFANTTFKAPPAFTVPSPSPALLQPTKTASPQKTPGRQDAETQFKNLVIRDVEDGPRDARPSFQTPSSGLLRDGVANSFGSGTKPAQIAETTPPAAYPAATFHQDFLAPDNPPQWPFCGRGRGHAGGDMPLGAPGRGVPAAGNVFGTPGSILSRPSGRGRAYIPYVNLTTGMVRPPPGFSALNN